MSALEPARFAPPPAVVERGRTWGEIREVAEYIASTEFVPRGLRNRPEAITACILYGQEVGLGPMQSLAKIAVIDGRPALASEAMRSLILGAGHSFWVEESTVSSVTVAGRRRGDTATSRVTWTMDDARRANLAGRSNWRAYPRQMLAARATAELARLIFADVVGGLGALEEIDESGALIESETTLEPVESEPPKAPTRRRKREQPATAQTSAPREAPPDAAPEPPLPGEPGYDLEAPAPAPVTKAQRDKLHASFRDRSVDRSGRLEWAGKMLERRLASFNELTSAEASLLLDVLESDEIPYGLPTVGDDPEGAGASVRAPEPPATESPESVPGEPQAQADAPSGAFSPPPQTFEGEPPHTPAMFAARIAGERLSSDLVRAVGRDLFPGKAPNDLDDLQRGELIGECLRRRGPS